MILLVMLIYAQVILNALIITAHEIMPKHDFRTTRQIFKKKLRILEPLKRIFA